MSAYDPKRTSRHRLGLANYYSSDVSSSAPNNLALRSSHFEFSATYQSGGPSNGVSPLG